MLYVFLAIVVLLFVVSFIQERKKIKAMKEAAAAAESLKAAQAKETDCTDYQLNEEEQDNYSDKSQD